MMRLMYARKSLGGIGLGPPAPPFESRVRCSEESLHNTRRTSSPARPKGDDMTHRMSQRAYARHRKERGLNPSSRGAIRHAIENGLVEVDEDGRVDPAEADKAMGGAPPPVDDGAEGFRHGVVSITHPTTEAVGTLAASIAIWAGASMTTAYALSRVLPVVLIDRFQNAVDAVDADCLARGLPPLWGAGGIKVPLPPDPDWKSLAEEAGEEVDVPGWAAAFQRLQEEADDA